jgi:hypothetical protein
MLHSSLAALLAATFTPRAELDPEHPDRAVSEMPADPNVCHMLMAGDELDDDDDIDGDDVLGDDLLGMDLVGAAKAIAKARKRAKPKWRKRVAPGVPVPGYGVFPVPLTPLSNNGIFSATVANITFSTVVQVPFRGERLLVDISRNSATATSQILAQNSLFVGIRPQTGVLGNLNLANYQRDSFGVRFVMQAAEQGAELKMFVFTNPVLSGTDEIAVSIEILGRVAA